MHRRNVCHLRIIKTCTEQGRPGTKASSTTQTSSPSHIILIQIDFTPLMEASKSGNTDIALLLLENGANPNKSNSVSGYSIGPAKLALALFPGCVWEGEDCTHCMHMSVSSLWKWVAVSSNCICRKIGLR